LQLFMNAKRYLFLVARFPGVIENLHHLPVVHSADLNE
jgi:hypothetical protein